MSNKIKIKTAKGTRKINLTPEMKENFIEQRRLFKEKFGRDPRPDDPVFFDPNKDTPTQITEEKIKLMMLEVLIKAGIAPEFIYAYEKTGLLVTEENSKIMPPEDVEAWDAAVEEYRQLKKKKKGSKK